MNCCEVAVHAGDDVAPASCWGNIATTYYNYVAASSLLLMLPIYVDAHCHQSTRCVEPQSACTSIATGITQSPKGGLHHQQSGKLTPFVIRALSSLKVNDMSE